MDVEELVHCQTVARLLINRVMSAISQRIGLPAPDRASASTVDQSGQDHHDVRRWHDDTAVSAEHSTSRT